MRNWLEDIGRGRALAVRQLPSWMPKEMGAVVLARARQGALWARFTQGERRVLRKRRRILPSQWAARHRVISESVLPGRWRPETVAYQGGIMDASFFPGVETVVVRKSVQSGMSECVHTCVGYAIDRDPGPCMYVFPDKDTAEDNSRDRILPMIESSRRLASHLTGYADDRSTKRIKLRHMVISLAWAHSVSRLGNKPVKHLVLDELDKYPLRAAKGETSPEKLAEKRLTTYRGYRHCWKISTPTVESGAISQAYEQAQYRYDYWVRCPDCGMWQVMGFDRIRWPETTRDPVRIAAENLAWYVCEHCGSCWDDHGRDRAVRLGQWREAESGLELMAHLNLRHPKSIAFQVPGWISTFMGLSEIAAAFLKGQRKVNPTGWKTALKDFMNNYKGEPWVDYEAVRDEDRILELRDERPELMVPGGDVVSCLIGGADTQDNGWWYEVRAFGWGMGLDSWQVRSGFVTSLEDLHAVMFGDEANYLDAQGREYAVRALFVDAMGHRTDEVYDYARLNRGRVVACKGERDPQSPARLSRPIEYYPGSGKALPGGLRLVLWSNQFFKDSLSARLEIKGHDPGAWRMNAEMSLEWARQMCAEYVDDETGRWVCPEHRANHAWDASLLCLVGAHWLRIKGRRPKAEQPRKQARARKAKANPFVDGLGALRT